jgi:hypothetical protein
MAASCILRVGLVVVYVLMYNHVQVCTRLYTALYKAIYSYVLGGSTPWYVHVYMYMYVHVMAQSASIMAAAHKRSTSLCFKEHFALKLCPNAWRRGSLYRFILCGNAYMYMYVQSAIAVRFASQLPLALAGISHCVWTLMPYHSVQSTCISVQGSTSNVS